VPNRPLRAFDIVDGAFALVRSQPKTVAAIAAGFVLPVQLLATWLDRGLIAAADFSDFANGSQTEAEFEAQLNDLSGSGGSLTSSVLQYMLLPFLGVALTHLVVGWRNGEARTAKDCLLFTLKRTHLILALFVLTKLFQVVTLMFATPITILAAPIMAAEGLGPIASLRRAVALGKRRYGQLFLLLLLIGLVSVLLSTALVSLPLVISALFGRWGWLVFFGLSAAGTTVLNLLGTGSAVLAYLDTRDRVEGHDLLARVEHARRV